MDSFWIPGHVERFPMLLDVCAAGCTEGHVIIEAYEISCINIRKTIPSVLVLTEGRCISRQNEPSGFVLRCP